MSHTPRKTLDRGRSLTCLRMRLAKHVVPSATVHQPGRLSVEQQRQRAVQCSCGWSGRVCDLAPVTAPNMVIDWSDDFPECPVCFGVGDMGYE